MYHRNGQGTVLNNTSSMYRNGHLRTAVDEVLIINLWGVGEAPREGSSVQHAVRVGTAMSRTPGPRPRGSGKAFPQVGFREMAKPRGEC